jgi:hypothetical protein
MNYGTGPNSQRVRKLEPATDEKPRSKGGARSIPVGADDCLSCQGQKLLGAIPEGDTIPAAATTDLVSPFRLVSHQRVPHGSLAIDFPEEI